MRQMVLQEKIIIRSTTDDGGDGGVGSAVVCSHCYVYSGTSDKGHSE